MARRQSAGRGASQRSRDVPPADPGVLGSQAQVSSPSYILPVLDSDFLLRDELRAVRFALEYEKAELLLREAGIRSTVVVFGSARILAPERARELLQVAHGVKALQLARRRLRQSVYYQMARDFGRVVSVRGGALDSNGGLRDNVIATGGGGGIMEAACRGAADAGAPAIGFNISLPEEQRPNAFITPSLSFQFHYFAMRKMHLAMRANALAVFPGGFGTMDELFEILTLIQTRKAPMIPVVLFGAGYWRRMINFHALADEGMISPEDLSLFEVVDDVESAWAFLSGRGLTAHTPSGSVRRARGRARKATRRA
jgi:uncharacterized protein (TIGR00730 family)